MLDKSVEPQLKLQKERGSDLTIFSPRASGMAHHVGTEAISQRMDADLQRPHPPHLPRSCPTISSPVGQLPQYPGAPPKNCIPELERIVRSSASSG